MATRKTPARGQRSERASGYPRWPVVVLAGSAFVAIWGGWVELGRLCGFGTVDLLPGIADVRVDLAITLPLGMEVYAAYAMGAWLTARPIEPGARAFAKWSALAALVVGGAGQVAYHLLAAAGVPEAPWPVVVVVACVPVAVLGMASQLAHRLHASAPPAADDPEPAAEAVPERAAAATAMAGTDDTAVPRARGPLGDDERARIVALAAEGLSARAIHRRVGRSRDTVTRVLARAAADR